MSRHHAYKDFATYTYWTERGKEVVAVHIVDEKDIELAIKKTFNSVYGVSWTVQPPTERKGSDGIMIVMLGKMKNVTKYVTVLLVAPPTRH